jgi:hypothetical protein
MLNQATLRDIKSVIIIAVYYGLRYDVNICNANCSTQLLLKKITLEILVHERKAHFNDSHQSNYFT